MNIVIGGIQGSGKGTQSKILAERYGLRHISIGDCIFGYFTTDPEFVLPYTMEKYQAGELAPSDIVNKVAAREISKGNFVLDGYPRQMAQLDCLLEQTEKVDLFVMMDMSEDECVKRLMSRGRSDDTEEGIRRRIAQYNEFTYPTLCELEMLVPTVRIDATETREAIAGYIDDAYRSIRGDFDEKLM